MHRAKAVRVADLPVDHIPGVMLKCRVCGGEYSAQRGDYFMLNPVAVMKCHKRNLSLVRRRSVYEAFEVAQ